MIRVVVVEDEPLAREHLVELLSELPGVAVVGAAENGRVGLAAIAEHRPDAVFLDIEMPGIKGTELMHLLPEPRPGLVFVTAYPQHAIEAFAGGAVHYLLKPISRIAVAQALSRIRPKDEPLQKEWLRLPVRKKGTTRLLRPEEVDALVADLGDCMAWTAEGRLPVDGTLLHWEERLSDHGFLRVHRNALVRLEAVRELTAEDELILGGGRLSISRRRMEEVRRVLGL
ncbi:LytTR family DNA-binding domain-containing protein [Geothrix sp. 21YS21S-4]|uniref:LytR/AlgR family response regulator transcription factor n=1 Tax=Geothrix sp. 21YS21S-4 TaxID=3068889 RepID=UPI0027B87DDE|nr:response regulator [Geothrix sp. 21YS21S-4]